MSILGCYEFDCGGESIAIERLFEEFKNIPELEIKLIGSKKLLSSGSLAYFSWLISSIFFWTRVIIQNRSANWIVTPTFTAGFAATLLKPFFDYKICFQHQGSRVPTTRVNTDLLRKLIHSVKYNLVKWMHQIFFARVDLVLILSKYSKRKLISDFTVLSNKRFQFIHNGVDLKKFHPLNENEKAHLRKRYQLSGKKVLLYVGRLNATKGVKKLFKVLVELKIAIPNILLIVAHPTNSEAEEIKYNKELLKLARENELDNNLRWYEENKNIADLYNVSDLFVLLSKEDNFPLVMLESLACKTLFSSTPSGAMQEILENIEPKLLIYEKQPSEIAQKIVKFLNLPNSQKQKLKSKGYLLVQELTWKKASAKVLKYLKED